MALTGKRSMIENIKENLSKIQEQIAPYTPNIIAVTKYYGIDAILNAYNAGLRNFGESRANEAIKKINSLPEEVKLNSKFHFIGHLQTNKVNKIVKNFDFIHSIDSLRVAQAVSSEALKIQKRQKVFLQINNANEEQKYGFSKKKLDESFEEILSLEGLEILGLMNIAPLTDNKNLLENLFEDVKETQANLEIRYKYNLREISMGMSNDYSIAVKHGATMLRIGRKLFT